MRRWPCPPRSFIPVENVSRRVEHAWGTHPAPTKHGKGTSDGYRREVRAEPAVPAYR